MQGANKSKTCYFRKKNERKWERKKKNEERKERMKKDLKKTEKEKLEIGMFKKRLQNLRIWWRKKEREKWKSVQAYAKKQYFFPPIALKLHKIVKKASCFLFFDNMFFFEKKASIFTPLLVK